MNAGLNEDQPKLGIFVLAVSFEMLADGDSLLDQHVKVLGYLRCETIRLEDTQDFVTSDDLDLSNTVRIS